MASSNEIIAELGFVTDRLSTQVRAIAIGVLALSWGILIGDSTTTRDLAAEFRWHFVGIGVAAVLVMFFDFLQYVAGYFNTMRVYRKMLRDSTTDAEFDQRALLFRLRKALFYIKMIALCATVAWLVTTLGRWLAVS